MATIKLKYAVSTFLALLLICCVYLGYRSRFRIAAKAWHWMHGYTCGVGNYDVPVPQGWLPKYVDSGDIVLYDAQNFASISILPGIPAKDLTFWEGERRQKLEGDNIGHILQHTIYLRDQTVSCIGGAEFSRLLNISAPDVISLDCQSTGPLHLMFLGQDSELETFYRIASQIKQRK